MFSEQLKEETKLAHQSLEKIIIQQIKAIKAPADYKMLLHFFYSYYHPLEQLLEPLLNDDIVPSFTERRKAEVLLQDIKNVSGPAMHYPDCTDLPSINNVSEAFGALYVLEGSTLGGAFIAKMLYKQASIPDDQLNFFKGYAEKGMEMWKAFIDALNAHVKQDGHGAEIIQTASKTFEKFESWGKVIYKDSPELTGPRV